MSPPSSLLLLVASAAAVLTAAAACSTDADCSLNGVCDASTNTCRCDPAWMGDDCSLLNLLPAPVCKDKYNLEFPCGFRQRTNTSWGGSVVPYKSQWVMAAAFMLNHCSLSDWTTNSAVIIAVADDPSGPYNYTSTAIQPWAHNPEMVVAPDGKGGSTYVIYTLGNGVPHGGPPKHCGSSSSSASDTADSSDEAVGLRYVSTNADGTRVMNFTVHYADSPLGPWTPYNTSIVNFPPKPATYRNWNPAPVVLSNGSVRIEVHTDVFGTWSGEIMVQSASWRGPFTAITGNLFECHSCAEDPFAWIDTRGHWHTLFHRVEDGAWSGGHAFSADGFVWSGISRAYNLSVPMENGKVFETKRRERPKLIFDSAGNPTHLTNGVESEHAGTFTVSVPIQTA